jgi:hypothetical protein
MGAGKFPAFPIIVMAGCEESRSYPSFSKNLSGELKEYLR